MARLMTLGHGTVPEEEMLELLRGTGVEAVVDVRRAPGSRRHPQYRRAALEEWLPAAGIAYRWEPRLGGWRKTRSDSPNPALHNESFRGYADHMQTGEFRAAVGELLEEADERPAAAMCSESLWRRCHRRLLADAAALMGTEVVHLLHDGSLEDHVLTEGVRWDERRAAPLYDRGETAPLPMRDDR